MQHETNKRDQMPASQGGRKPLIIAHEPPGPPEPRGPGEGSLHDESAEAARQNRAWPQAV